MLTAAGRKRSALLPHGLDKGKRRWRASSPKLTTELLHHRSYATHNKAKRDFFPQAEGFYNSQRLDPALDCRTPNQAERQAANVA